jgi:hypothetical protein
LYPNRYLYLQKLFDLNVVSDDLSEPEPLVLRQDRGNVVIVGGSGAADVRHGRVEDPDENVEVVSHFSVRLLLLLLLLTFPLVSHVQVESGSFDDDWSNLEDKNSLFF